jgi:alkylhydroperoxidase family enzyme
MPVIEPVPWDDLDPELQDMVTRGRATGMLSTPIPSQIWAYRPELAKEHIRRYALIFDDGILDPRLLELVRLRMASFNDCEACLVARKSDTVEETDVACLSSQDDRFTPAEQAALRYAELFATDHLAIDDTVFEELGRHFSKPEIIELMVFVAGVLGGGRMVHVLRAWDWDEAPPVLRYEGEFATHGVPR